MERPDVLVRIHTAGYKLYGFALVMVETRVIPNFFIVGAPKCGTTALSEYLRAHPNVFMSNPKEPYKFADDFPRHRIVESADDYMLLFRRRKSEHLAVGEASAGYLFSSAAVKNIHRFNKDAKIIVMIRNPIDMVYSLHSQFVFDGAEDERDFETAWRLQRERREGSHIPRRCRTPAFLQYADVGMLGRQMERLLRVFPERQVKCVVFDDLREKARDVYEDVLEFLEVPSDGRVEFPPVNRNKMQRVRSLGIFLQNPPSGLHKAVLKTKIFFGLKQIPVWRTLIAINAQRAPRALLRQEFQRELQQHFRADIEKLSCLLDRDLSDWLTV